MCGIHKKMHFFMSTRRPLTNGIHLENEHNAYVV
jgi:hypothetical protein